MAYGDCIGYDDDQNCDEWDWNEDPPPDGGGGDVLPAYDPNIPDGSGVDNASQDPSDPASGGFDPNLFGSGGPGGLLSDANASPGNTLNSIEGSNPTGDAAHSQDVEYAASHNLDPDKGYLDQSGKWVNTEKGPNGEVASSGHYDSDGNWVKNPASFGDEAGKALKGALGDAASGLGKAALNSLANASVNNKSISYAGGNFSNAIGAALAAQGGAQSSADRLRYGTSGASLCPDGSPIPPSGICPNGSPGSNSNPGGVTGHTPVGGGGGSRGTDNPIGFHGWAQ